MNIDIKNLDWQPCPHDHHAATAHVEAGEKKLRIDAGFRIHHVRDHTPRPETGILVALRSGNLKGISAYAVPIDGDGDAVVDYSINTGRSPSIELDTSSAGGMNAQLSRLADTLANSTNLLIKASSARADEMRGPARRRDFARS